MPSWARPGLCCPRTARGVWGGGGGAPWAPPGQPHGVRPVVAVLPRVSCVCTGAASGHARTATLAASGLGCSPSVRALAMGQGGGGGSLGVPRPVRCALLGQTRALLPQDRPGSLGGGGGLRGLPRASPTVLGPSSPCCPVCRACVPGQPWRGVPAASTAYPIRRFPPQNTARDARPPPPPPAPTHAPPGNRNFGLRDLRLPQMSPPGTTESSKTTKKKTRSAAPQKYGGTACHGLRV